MNNAIVQIVMAFLLLVAGTCTYAAENTKVRHVTLDYGTTLVLHVEERSCLQPGFNKMQGTVLEHVEEQNTELLVPAYETRVFGHLYVSPDLFRESEECLWGNEIFMRSEKKSFAIHWTKITVRLRHYSLRALEISRPHSANVASRFGQQKETLLFSKVAVLHLNGEPIRVAARTVRSFVLPMTAIASTTK